MGINHIKLSGAATAKDPSGNTIANGNNVDVSKIDYLTISLGTSNNGGVSSKNKKIEVID